MFRRRHPGPRSVRGGDDSFRRLGESVKHSRTSAENRHSPSAIRGYSPRVSVTLTGLVERITYENEQTGFRVVRLGKLEGEGARSTSAVVVGSFQAVGPGMRLRVTGDYVVDAR